MEHRLAYVFLCYRGVAAYGSAVIWCLFLCFVLVFIFLGQLQDCLCFCVWSQLQYVFSFCLLVLIILGRSFFVVDVVTSWSAWC